jgi:hypothetical protein
VNLTNFVIHASVEKNAFGGRGLAGIDMSADTNIPIAVDGSLAGHLNLLLIGWSFLLPNRPNAENGGLAAPERSAMRVSLVYQDSASRLSLQESCQPAKNGESVR